MHTMQISVCVHVCICTCVCHMYACAIYTHILTHIHMHVKPLLYWKVLLWVFNITCTILTSAIKVLMSQTSCNQLPRTVTLILHNILSRLLKDMLAFGFNWRCSETEVILHRILLTGSELLTSNRTCIK